MSIFYVVLNITAVMLGLMAVGYLLGRKKLVSEKAGRDLAVLEVRLFLPSYLFVTLARNVVPEKINVNIEFLLFGTLFIAGLIAVSYVMSRFAPGGGIGKLMLFYIMLYPNFGYFGYPVIEAAFGTGALAQYIMFTLPMTFGVNTHGAYMLTGGRSAEKSGKAFSLKTLKTLPIEVMLAVILGTAVGISGLKLPGVLEEFFSFTGACMSPVSMLLAGFILSSLPPSKLFRSPPSYIINALKLLALPLFTGLSLYSFGVRGMMLAFPVIITSLPVGMNVVIFSNPDQPDYTDNGVTCFISYILALLTVPTVFGLLSIFM